MDKLAEIEQQLTTSGRQWLSDGNMPGAEDSEALAIASTVKIDPRVYPHAAFWYSMVSKMAPGKLPAATGKPAAPAKKPQEEESKGGKAAGKK